jgi:hypothetical protein
MLSPQPLRSGRHLFYAVGVTWIKRECEAEVMLGMFPLVQPS